MTRLGILLAAAGLVVSGCSEWFVGAPDAPPLPGERISVLALDSDLRPDERLQDLEVRLPKPFANPDWPQQGGFSNHAMHHLAAPGNLAEQWSRDIGSGSDSETALLSAPVIAGGVVYVMDVDATVTAYREKDGAELWETDLESEIDDEGIKAGGLAYSGGRLFATTGFAEVFSLDAKSGKILWRKRVPGPSRAAPAVRDGQVYVITIANSLHALSAVDGRELWDHSGISEVAGLLGAASAAVDEGTVVVPFSSGELIALRADNGRVSWSESLVSLRRTDPVSALAHIRGRPVIDRGQVFAISHSGRMVAVDLRTGNRLWERGIGGTQQPWVAGDFIYVLTNGAEIVCLWRGSGRVRWLHQLSRFENEEKLKDPIQWTGPVLAGDRLLVTASNGEIVSLSPYTGKLLGAIEVSDDIRLPPVVAGGAVYLLTDDAELIALR